MTSRRITKSAVDWAKFARLVPESDRAQFAAFKARSDGYLRKMMSYPENPPPIDWNAYRATIANKSVVDELEKSYKAVSVPYPKDTLSATVDEQEKEAEKIAAEFCEWSECKVKEAEVLLYKFKVMIPYDQMTEEEFALTFPDWVNRIENASVWPHPDKEPGLSKEERKKAKIINPPPYSIIKDEQP
ncbi:ATP synthase subunit d: mitochondrial-like protein [Dinothrombium tinctorium]|uniref:ATP synthase subunit d, mitochondrial n=1 Tax=Dinothrombium tinctorium TaxID=1965070 RepID=A0A443RHD5_9ACAR|nr:ATP synthase subunit d: mitochondrial-like protein [Dinothrombium tinctorium]